MTNKKINLALTDETVLVTSVNADGLDVKTIIKDGYFYCYLVGMSYLSNYNEFRQYLIPGTLVSLSPDPNNLHDPYAIAVNYENIHVGYISKKFTPFVEPCFDDDILYAEIVNVSEKYIRLRVRADFKKFTHNNSDGWGHLSFVIEDKKRPNALLRFIKSFGDTKDYLELKYIPQEEYSSYFYYEDTAKKLNKPDNSFVIDDTKEEILSDLQAELNYDVNHATCPMENVAKDVASDSEREELLRRKVEEELLRRKAEEECRIKFYRAEHIALPTFGFSGGEHSKVSQKKAKPYVFLSYSREDSNLPILKEIRKYLEEKNIKYFMDTKDIRGGMNYINAIVDAIAKCGLVLFIASNNSYKSRALNELLVAHRKNKPVLSYVIDKSEMPDNVYFLVGMYNYMDSDEYDIPHCLIPAIEELLISSAED